MIFNKIKIKLIILLSILIISEYYFPVIAFSEEKFWIPEGELSCQIKDRFLYLINRRESGSYYYGKYKEKKYTPVDNNPTPESLKFQTTGTLPKNLEPQNFEKNQWNIITKLVFKHGTKNYSVKKYKGGYWIYNTEKGFNPSEINCLPINDIKSNYIINLEDHQALLHKALKRSSDEIEENKNETPFLKLLEKSLRKNYKKQINFSVINNINMKKCKSDNILDSLYQFLDKKESELQRDKLNDFHNSYKKLHNNLDNYRNHQNKLRDIKSGIAGFINKILLSEDKIENMNKSIRDKERMIETQKKIYQGNHEAHAEYGIYIFEYDEADEQSFLQQNDEIEILTKKSAMKHLSQVFIQSESMLKSKSDGRSGKQFFYDWIETVKDGYITINPTKNDCLPIGTFKNLVIKTVKYLPRTNPQYDSQNLKENKRSINFKNKYKQFSVLNNEQLEDLLKYINDFKQIKVDRSKLIARIKDKYDDIMRKKEDVYDVRKDFFQEFITEINKIENDISSQLLKIQEQKKNIEQYKLSISSRINDAKEEYENAKQTLVKMNQISKELIHKINNIFKFNLYAIGNSFRQVDENPIRHFSRLIKNILVSIDSRCNMVRETIKSTVENGFLVKEESSSIELLKKYITLSIFSEITITQEKFRISYVVLKLETEIFTQSDLHPQSFDSHLVDLNDLWKETNELVDVKNFSIERVRKPKAFQPQNIEPTKPKSLNAQKNKLTPKPFHNNSYLLNSCDNLCLKIGGRIFSFKYFRYDQLYDDISYNEKTPFSIAQSIKDGHKKWSLPTVNDLISLIGYLKMGNNLPVDIFQKRIYTSEPTYVESKFNVLRINEAFIYEKEKIDSSDMAFLIFVSNE